MYFFKVFGIG